MRVAALTPISLPTSVPALTKISARTLTQAHLPTSNPLLMLMSAPAMAVTLTLTLG